jgi:anti-anti-sigma regulatory factor
MLRISQDEKTDGSVSVRLEGVLSGPWVDEMGRVCGVIVNNGQPLRIDLEEVIFVDRAGIELLANLRKRNAVLDHCSPFLNVQLAATLA